MTAFSWQHPTGRRAVRGGRRQGRPRRRDDAPLSLERCEPRLALAIDADVWVQAGTVMTGGFDHDREGTPGAIAPYQQVFTYRFGEDPQQPFRLSDPGFNSAPVLPTNYRLTFAIDAGLRFWSGTGQPSFTAVTGGVELNLRNRLANWNQRVGGSTTSTSPLVVQTIPANRQVHRHLDASIGTGGTGETFATAGAPAGIYAFSARIGLDPGTTGQPAITSSLPVHYLFSIDAAAAARDAARDHFRDIAIGTASLTLAVDDGPSTTDGITTDGRINVGGLNPRATHEFSVNGGVTWTPLGAGGSFLAPAGTHAAGSLRVRQTVVDHHGSRSTVGVNSSAVTVAAGDTVRPTLAITTSRSTLAAGQTATITFTVSESVTGFTASDVAVSGGTLSGFNGAGTAYTATFTPFPNMVTQGTVGVAAGAFADTAGNPNLAASLASPIAIDTTTTVAPGDTVAPTVTIASNRTALAAGQTALISFTVSEPVTGFTASDVSVSGGTLSGFTAAGTVYTATFTPLSNAVTQGTLSVAAGGFADAAGNTNLAATLAPPIAIDTRTTPVAPGDTVAPTVTITTSRSPLAPGQASTITFVLSEPVAGFTADAVVVTGGSLSGFSGSGTAYTATLVPLPGAGAAATVMIAAGSFVDIAGNANAAAFLSIPLWRPPSDVRLSGGTIRENMPAGTAVGRFVTTDPDPGETFTYALAAGPGSGDNQRFAVVGAELRTTQPFDFETRGRLSIRVAVRDSRGLELQKVLQIAVTNVLEPPRILQVIAPEPRVYRRGERLTWTIVSTEMVTVHGRPFLPIRIGGRDATAEYVSGSGSARLVFAYTVTGNESPGAVWAAGSLGVRPRTRIRTAEERMPLDVPGGAVTAAGVTVDPRPVRAVPRATAVARGT